MTLAWQFWWNCLRSCRQAKGNKRVPQRVTRYTLSCSNLYHVYPSLPSLINSINMQILITNCNIIIKNQYKKEKKDEKNKIWFTQPFRLFECIDLSYYNVQRLHLRNKYFNWHYHYFRYICISIWLHYYMITLHTFLRTLLPRAKSIVISIWFVCLNAQI